MAGNAVWFECRRLPLATVCEETRERIGMKIVRYSSGSGEGQFGILEDSTVYAASGELFSGLTKGAEVGSVDSVKLLAPVQPGKVVCVGLNYALHIAEGGRQEIPTEPVIFMKPTTSIIGPDETIEIANLENNTDYEAELAVVIGKTAKDVEEANATDYILGYTGGNDVSDRVLQKKDGQWVRAKGFDTYCPLGPCIETEMDYRDVGVVSRLNGETRQNSSTKHQIFSVPFLISFLSKVMTLEPGDVIMTGTPEGVGPMKPGDSIEVEIAGVGVLSNPVGKRG
jgi:2-keto-4-pentenoate hydratase/2-oxohepta-3-ene-1,7-dioic acid hydratase in catechol pathway